MSKKIPKINPLSVALGAIALVGVAFITMGNSNLDELSAQEESLPLEIPLNRAPIVERRVVEINAEILIGTTITILAAFGSFAKWVDDKSSSYDKRMDEIEKTLVERVGKAALIEKDIEILRRDLEALEDKLGRKAHQLLAAYQELANALASRGLFHARSANVDWSSVPDPPTVPFLTPPTPPPGDR